MTEEERIILESIDEQYEKGRLKNIKLIHDFIEQYKDKPGVVAELENDLRSLIYDFGKTTKYQLQKEIESAITEASHYVVKGEYSKALEVVEPITYIPGFNKTDDSFEIDCLNNFEFYCYQLRDTRFAKHKLHFGHVSYLLGKLYLVLGDTKKSLEFMSNAVKWNQYSSKWALDAIRIKYDTYLQKRKGKKLTRTEIYELQNDLAKAYRYIYEPENLVYYFDLVVRVLLQEDKKNEALAMLSFCFEYADYLNVDNVSMRSLMNELGEELNEQVPYSKNKMHGIAKNACLNIDISTEMYLLMISYLTDEGQGEQQILWNHGVFRKVSGEHLTKLARVKFRFSPNKMYDYICNHNNIFQNDVVMVEVGSKEKEATVDSFSYTPTTKLPLEFSRYKMVTRLLFKK